MKKNLKKIHSDTQEYIEFAPNIYLKTGKVHEICGPAKIRIATLIAAKTRDLIVWIRPDWKDFIVNTDGISDWFSPNQLLLINAKNKNDLYFSTEEVLRSGISEVIITELTEIPISLQMRRIHLAITNGSNLNNIKKPLSLILSPNKGGANSVESRWYASTLPCWKDITDEKDGNLTQKWYVERLFSRTDPVKKWSIETTNTKKKGMAPKLLSLPIT